MSVHYTTFHGHSCSDEIKVVLDAAVQAGVLNPADVNSLHRSMADQQHEVDLHGIWSPSNPHGAARPSPIAPHIKVGRKDHAQDINSPQVLRYVSWVRQHGVSIFFTVSTEPWHVEFGSESELLRLVAKVKSKPDSAFLTKDEHQHVKILQTERAVAKRHGGWHKHIDAGHLQRANASKAWLQHRAKVLHGLDQNKLHRRERQRYLRKVIAG